MAISQQTRTFLEQPIRMLIGGNFVESSSQETFITKNPANGQELAQVPLATQEDVDNAVSHARKAFQTTWKEGIGPTERAELLLKLADLMQRDFEVFVELETLDNGKPLDKAKYDVQGAIEHLKYYAGWPSKICGTTIPVDSSKLVYTQKEPLGVVGLIVPWNFPLMIAMWKLAPALAAGNCCVLKPAEQTPLTALYLGKLIVEAAFPPGVVNILSGPGYPTGSAISSHMDIDKVSFTGSTEVGRKIMKAAAESNLKKVSLELGGKSPNVIFEDADLDKVLKSLPWSSFYNTGQECTLGSRVYVQDSIFDKVLEALQSSAAQLTLGNGLESPDLGPMISENQLNTVLKYVQSGIEEGATLICGGKRSGKELSNGYFLPPTIFVAETQNLTILKEEIFGPVVVLSRFSDFEDAVSKANDTVYGLAAAVWTKDVSKALRFANEVEAGTVWINGYDLFSPAVPFGGMKQSGNEKEMGQNAIDLYTKEKTVWTSL